MKTIILIVFILPFIGFSQLPYHLFTFDDTTQDDFLYRDTVSNPNCIWQIGEPQKTVFNTAFSVPNVIVTDTINSYPVNDTSSFVIKHKVGNGFSQLNGAYPIAILSGKYYVNSDTLNDFGKIEFSPDNGISWLLISEDTLQNINYDWFLYSPQPILTGNSQGWNSFKIEFWKYDNMIINYGDTILFKFSFISDFIYDDLAGLMFDELMIQDDTGGGIESTTSELKLYPNPFNEELFISKLDNLSVIKLFDISGKIVLTQNLDESKSFIETTDLNSGIYQYRIYNSTNLIVKTGKLIKY